jgi:hypothetical protein
MASTADLIKALTARDSSVTGYRLEVRQCQLVDISVDPAKAITEAIAAVENGTARPQAAATQLAEALGRSPGELGWLEIHTNARGEMFRTDAAGSKGGFESISQWDGQSYRYASPSQIDIAPSRGSNAQYRTEDLYITLGNFLKRDVVDGDDDPAKTFLTFKISDHQQTTLRFNPDLTVREVVSVLNGVEIIKSRIGFPNAVTGFLNPRLIVEKIASPNAHFSVRIVEIVGITLDPAIPDHDLQLPQLSPFVVVVDRRADPAIVTTVKEIEASILNSNEAAPPFPSHANVEPTIPIVPTGQTIAEATPQLGVEVPTWVIPTLSVILVGSSIGAYVILRRGSTSSKQR